MRVIEFMQTRQVAARAQCRSPARSAVGRTAALVATLLVAGLPGCGSKASAPAGNAASTRASPTAATSAAPAAVVEMVNAVPAGRASNAFSLKFDVKSRPTTNEPVDIEVALTPGLAFDRVQLVFRVNEGLEIRSGATMAPVERPEVGVALHHTVTVVPKGAGIYSVSAVIQSESVEGTISRTYAIPLIAGEGLAAPAAASETETRAGTAPAAAQTADRAPPAS